MWLKYGNIYGKYENGQPVLIVSDPKIIDNILVRHFAEFADQMAVDQSAEPIDMNTVLALTGDNWRRVRNVLSTVFTASKMKELEDVFNLCRDELFSLVDQYIERGLEIDMKYIYDLYMLDVTVKCFYSLSVDVYENPRSKFVESARSFADGFNAFNMFVLNTLPQWVVKLLQLSYSDTDGTEYMKQFIAAAIKQRSEHHVRRQDLLQALLDARTRNADIAHRGLKEIEVLANAIIFLAIGYDSSSSTMAFLSWRLALNPVAQEKVYREVLRVLGNDPEKQITYEDLQKLTYLEAAINETLRMNPIDVRISRRTTCDVIVPGTDIKLPPGTAVQIPLYVLHYDPHNFEDPELFKPERFLPEHKSTLKSCTFLGFGAGE